MVSWQPRVVVHHPSEIVLRSSSLMILPRSVKNTHADSLRNAIL